MEFLIALALGALAVLAFQRITAKARSTRKTLNTKTRRARARVRTALGTQTVATTSRRKGRKGGRR